MTRPVLPPKRGHVEKADVDGNHYYAPTRGTLAALEQKQKTERLETESTTLSAKLQAAVESNAFLEECLIEMAGLVYA